MILVRTHQDLKMVKKIVYSQKKCREKFHVMGQKKRSETRQTREREGGEGEGEGERERDREVGEGDKRQKRDLFC